MAGNRLDLRETLGVEVLGDRSLGAAVLAIDDVAEAGRALAARPVVQLVEEAARLCGGARRRDGAHHSASLHRFRQPAEAGPAEEIGRGSCRERVLLLVLLTVVLLYLKKKRLPASN